MPGMIIGLLGIASTLFIWTLITIAKPTAALMTIPLMIMFCYVDYKYGYMSRR